MSSVEIKKTVLDWLRTADLQEIQDTLTKAAVCNHWKYYNASEERVPPDDEDLAEYGPDYAVTSAWLGSITDYTVAVVSCYYRLPCQLSLFPRVSRALKGWRVTLCPVPGGQQSSVTRDGFDTCAEAVAYAEKRARELGWRLP